MLRCFLFFYKTIGKIVLPHINLHETNITLCHIVLSQGKKKKNPSFVPFQGRPEKSGEFFYTYTYINIHILYIKGKQKKPIPAGKLITVLPTLHTIQ